MAEKTSPCASGDRCALGGVINLASSASHRVNHRCRDCQKLIHGALCCGYHDEASVFVCFPCFESKRKEPVNQQATVASGVVPPIPSSHRHRPPQPQQQQNTTTTPNCLGAFSSRSKAHLKTPFFKTGDFVERNGLLAWVINSEQTPEGRHNLYGVRYAVDSRRQSFGIPLGSIKPATLQPTGRKRGSETTGLSLLSSNLQRPPRLPPKEKAVKVIEESTVQRLSLKVQKWINGGKMGRHPLVSFLKRNATKEKGYMQDMQAKSLRRNINGIHLGEEEWNWVLGLRSSLDHYQRDQKRDDPKYHPAKSLAMAWGITPQAMNQKRKRMLENPFLSNKRKKQDDVGETIFNSDRRRNFVYTPVNMFRKKMLMNATKDNPITTIELQEQWSNISDEDKVEYEHIAANQKQRAVTLVTDIQAMMINARGAITWKEIESGLRGGAGNLPLVDAETIRKYVMALPELSYQSTRIHPKLDAQLRARRYEFAHAFWIFWSTAKAFAQKCQIILVQMDEKWFYALVVRRNNKSIPFLGVEPVNHPVRHKSHIGKVLVICSTAFEPTDNDMEKGGIAHKVSFERVGKMGTAEKDSYKRVYKPGGGYHYPKIAENRIRKAGDPVWRHLEITGSSEKSEKKPKYSLLKNFYSDIEVPRLKEIAREREAATGKRIRFAYQIDGAGPHQDKTLLTSLSKQLHEIDSFLFFQPSQSPLTNTNDACTFPKLSKDVSREQSLHHGSRMACSEDRIWELAQKVYKELPAETLARAYAGHHQIVNAIYRDKGGDSFAQERNGLHCGIRRVYVPKYASDNPGENENPIGVEAYDCPDEVDIPEGLKYPTPEVTEDMIEQSGDYLRRGHCELLLDELEKLMEDETRPDYDDLAIKVTSFGMALDGMSSDSCYA
jgi:hypothetical protein